MRIEEMSAGHCVEKKSPVSPAPGQSVLIARFNYHVNDDRESMFIAPDNIDECDWIAALSCAEDYYHNHGGVDSDWPINLTLVAPSGTEFLFRIDMVYEPQFYARKLKE